MKRVAIALVLLLAAGAYVTSPFWTLWRLGRALEARDSWTIVSHIDFPSLRESLSLQLTAAHLGEPRTGLRIKRTNVEIVLAPQLVNSFVGQLVTPAGVRAALENGWLDKLASAETAGPSAEAGGGAPSAAGAPNAGLLRAWAFSSPPRFWISLGRGSEAERWVTLRLRFSGLRWLVYAVELPPEFGRELLNGRLPV